MADAANAAVTRSGDKVAADIAGDNNDTSGKEGSNGGKKDDEDGFGGMEKTLMYIGLAIVALIVLKKLFKF